MCCETDLQSELLLRWCPPGIWREKEALEGEFRAVLGLMDADWVKQGGTGHPGEPMAHSLSLGIPKSSSVLAPKSPPQHFPSIGHSAGFQRYGGFF